LDRRKIAEVLGQLRKQHLPGPALIAQFGCLVFAGIGICPRREHPQPRGDDKNQAAAEQKQQQRKGGETP
jgi:hypothetical protein